ncbi:hypothetical protein [Pseudomonas sp.]|nr:hypothetical protein [Pseudomonas sp.]HUE93107.1 hypothetical protein [Pseudomonas sp.]
MAGNPAAVTNRKVGDEVLFADFYAVGRAVPDGINPGSLHPGMEN